MKMKWASEYNTGIDVIDEQHKRILDYINEIDDVKDDEDRRRIKDVLDNIIDYTQSHFTFEESLQEEADYKYRVPHKRVPVSYTHLRAHETHTIIWYAVFCLNIGGGGGG
ncbi:bacteriohemerythrin, partial [Acinetobacter baumannii]